MSDESPGFALYSSSSRQRKSLEFRFQQSPRWAPTSSTSDRNEQTPCCIASVPRPKSSNPQCLNDEKGFDRDSTAISTSFRSLLSLSESSAPWETPSKQPSNLTQCGSYPRVFCNPVSDCENPEPDHRQEDSSTNLDSSSIMSTGNHQSSPVEEEASRNHQGSPVEEEASRNHQGSPVEEEALPNHQGSPVDVERSNETEAGNPRTESDSTANQRCGVCKKLLSQKSPWCSYKILRSGDMPAAAVFPCHHVYHVECLDKVTPTAQTRDPCCPVCSNTIEAMEQPMIVPETLQMALRSLRRSHTAVRSETVSSTCNDNQRRHISRRSQRWEKLSCCLNISFLSSS